MAIPPELLPVIQITLPLILAIFGAAWIQNKRFDDINKRLDDIIARMNAIDARLNSMESRLISIEVTLRNHVERITRLEERIPPLVHKN